MPRAIVIRSNPAHEHGDDRPVNTAAVEEVDESFLGDDPVLVEVSHSSINYKDAMALTGLPGIVRRTPLIGGIDLVGTVRQSSDPLWRPGEAVLLNGIGMSETRNGAFSELARVPGDRLVALPSCLSPARAAPGPGPGRASIPDPGLPSSTTSQSPTDQPSGEIT